MTAAAQRQRNQSKKHLRCIRYLLMETLTVIHRELSARLVTVFSLRPRRSNKLDLCMRQPI